MKKKGLLLCLALLSGLSLVSCAKDGHTPKITIGENGNWYVDGEDQGVPAQGEKGDTGISIVSVTKGVSIGNTDTYIVNYSDGTSSSFTVKNGKDGENADDLTVKNVSIKSSINTVDTYEIEFSDGFKTTFTVTNGTDGKNLSVISINKESTDGLYDTYKISFSDESYQTFIVKNGEDGLTPYIGDNGNWWIGDEDTGVLADYERLNDIPLTIYSSGLEYKLMTLEGNTGYIVTGWNEDLIENYLISKYGYEKVERMLEDDIKTGHLVIPNYIGNVPVIGVTSDSRLNFGKITLSKNTIFLGDSAFKNCSYLQDIDFNDCKIIDIPKYCFYGTALQEVDIPNTVTKIQEYAFSNCKIKDFNFTNITFVGNHAFDALVSKCVYLNKNVEYVGDCSLGNSYVYIESETLPNTWDDHISECKVTSNVKKSEDYLYSINDNEVTLYQYLGNEDELEIPATIDDKPVVAIGYGFNSYAYDNNFSGLTSKEIYQYLNNNEGYISKLIIGNNVKRIEQGALLNGNMFIYVSKNVEEIQFDNNSTIGLFRNSDVGYVHPYSLVVLEDSTKTKFKEYNGDIRTYDELTGDEDFDMLVKANIKYEDIYYDSDNCMYYFKDGLYYSTLACKTRFVDSITILDSINNIPVKTIEKYSIELLDANVINIGNNITKIKSYGISVEANVYIPSNVEIINADAIEANIIFVEASSKPDDWDSNWTSSNAVFYGVGEVGYNNFFMYSIKNNKVALLRYIGESMNLYIPSAINDLPVTEIKSNFITFQREMEIFIPSSVTKVGNKAFVNNYSYQVKVYCETESIPEGWDSAWFSGTKTLNLNQSDYFDYIYNDDYVYQIIDGKVKLLAYCGNNTTIYVPREIDGKKVTSIGEYCFTLTKTTSIYIPKEIENIEAYSFYGLYSGTFTYYLELSKIPSTWNSYWSSGSSSYNYNCIFDY